MNRNTNQFSWIVACLLAGLVTVTGCDFDAAKDAFDQFDIIVQLEEVQTSATVSLIDSQTGAFLNVPVTMTFRGQNEDDIVDAFADPVEEIEVEGGIGTFGIANSISPSASNPVSVRVLADAPGFESGSISMQITSTGQTTGKIFMSRMGQTVQGGSTASTGSSTSGGTSQQPIEAQTQPTGQTSQTASVSVNQGTRMQTSSGSSASGNVNLNISYYPQITRETVAAFPGGMSTTVQAADGTQQESAVSITSFANITITDEQGNEITQFDPPIAITMDIDASSINPATGVAYRAGDEVTILSYDESEAVWIVENTSSVDGPNGQGNLYTVFTTPHLSTFGSGSTETCSVGINVTRNGWKGPIEVDFSSADQTYSHSASLAAGSSSLTQNFPDGKDAVITFTKGSTQIDRITIADLCGQGTVSHSLTAPPPELIEVTFDVDLGPACEALRITSVNAFTVSYRKVSESDNQASTIQITNADLERDGLDRINGGSVLVSDLEQGATYLFFTTFDNTRRERQITITGPAMTLDVSGDVDEDVCAAT